jgi:hypothetical protein
MRNKYDQRHTCNAREVVVYLRYTSNFRIANRVAIMTNLCNYDLCLDTSFLEASSYGLNDAVSFQAILNDGLSSARYSDKFLLGQSEMHIMDCVGIEFVNYGIWP